MKKTKKIIALFLAAVMLVCTTVAATVAYLTSSADVVKNTFTVGNVEIDLDEAKVTEYGVKDGDTRVTENKYKLIPGHEYVKDPTVYVKPGSEECYVFIKVENALAGIESEDYDTIADQIETNGWRQLVDADNNEIENVFYYNETVVNLPAEDETHTDVVLPVFANFVIGDEAELYDANGDFIYETAEITIDAYAVQADGFDSAFEAWDAATPIWE